MCALSVNWFMYTSHIAADNIAQLNNQYFFFGGIPLFCYLFYLYLVEFD